MSLSQRFKSKEPPKAPSIEYAGTQRYYKKIKPMNKKEEETQVKGSEYIFNKIIKKFIV